MASRRLDLELADSFGVVQQTLASFNGGSLGWLTWSPDGSRFAFVRSSEDLPGSGTDVYVYNMLDGLLSQVYRGQTIGGLAFSPDGSTLVIQDDDPTGRHLFVVDLDTFQQRLVQSPNVALDEWWLAPSWQPLARRMSFVVFLILGGSHTSSPRRLGGIGGARSPVVHEPQFHPTFCNSPARQPYNLLYYVRQEEK